MAHPQYNAYQQQLSNLPPVNTHHPQQHPNHGYNSPSAMSPTGPGFNAAKRQTSPYHSPFSASPYANSPPGNYLSLPQSPAAMQPHAFHQPQPYNDVNARPPPSQGSMPPPKMPYSKAQDGVEQLEKARPSDMDPNMISDVLTGSGIDLRAEEDNLLHNFGTRAPAYGASFNSQASASTASPHGSFNQWGQATQGHGAFQGTGPLSQSLSQEQQQAEFLRKHDQAARALAEAAQTPLSDPFLFANVLRHRIAKRAYEHGVKVNVEGLFDRIPEYPQNVTRTTVTGSNGESISEIRADSLLNQNASFVELLSLLSLAAEERVRSVLDDAVAMKEIRQKTSHGTVPHDMVDLVPTNSKTKSVTVGPLNISKSAWEVPDSAVSPMTQTAGKHPLNAARLPTPPTDAPPTPHPTIELIENHVANTLKRRMTDDLKYEEMRLKKRQKRKEGTSATPTEAIAAPLPPPPDKMSKKEQIRQQKAGQTEEVLHAKTNETSRMAIFGKKTQKYAWMTGGAGGGKGSGATTPRLNTSGLPSGSSTPAPAQINQGLQARKRTYGQKIENSDIGDRLQLRDVIHVLEDDGRERKTLVTILARLKNTDKDERRKDDRRQATVPPVQ